MTIYLAEYAGLGPIRMFHLPRVRTAAEALKQVQATQHADPRRAFVRLYEAWPLDMKGWGNTPPGIFYWTGTDQTGKEPRLVDEIISCKNNHEARQVVKDAGIKGSVLYRCKPIAA
jgi:hypothetical protein